MFIIKVLLYIRRPTIKGHLKIIAVFFNLTWDEIMKNENFVIQLIEITKNTLLVVNIYQVFLHCDTPGIVIFLMRSSDI